MIEVDNVSKIFSTRRAETVALRDISLAVAEGEFVSVLGPSGCGKSTLLRILAGLSEPSAGAVRIDGKTVKEPSPRIGIVFQQPVLLRWRSVLKNVLLPAEILGLDADVARQRAFELLKLTELTDFQDSLPHELSGGMQQRVALCRALVSDPEILLMDEPFGALDALTREQMQYELLSIWEERQKTVVFITHSISEAVMLSDRVEVMTSRPGRVAETRRVNIPRPRSIDDQTSDEFQELSQHLRKTLGIGQGTARPSKGRNMHV